MTRASPVIGYSPYSVTLNHPADRRRLVRWAALRNIRLDTTSPFQRSIVYLNVLSNLPKWVAHKRAHPEVKVVLEIVDSYLAGEPSYYQNGRRTLYKVFNGELAPTLHSYQHWLRELTSAADHVVCSSPEQASMIQPLNDRVSPILDFHDELPMMSPHENISGNGSLSLLWEGQSVTINHLIALQPQLTTVARGVKMTLNVVSDSRKPLMGRTLPARRTESLLKSAFDSSGITVNFSPWSPEALMRAANVSDVGIIPISEEDRFGWAKPENKLLIMWRLGLPALVSATPAYSRVMRDAGVQHSVARDATDWTRVLLENFEMPNLLSRNACAGQEYLQLKHSEQALASQWDAVFADYLP